MVVTKVIQIKSEQSLDRAMKYIADDSKTLEKDALHRAMDYIVNEAKTFTNASENITEFPHKVVDGKVVYQLVSSYGVSHHSTATDEFEMTRMNAQSKFGKRGSGEDVIAHHIIQSFSPEDDLSPQEIHEIGRRTILELTGGQHEFKIATHIDRGHIHNHIIFNATNMVTLKKFRWQKGTKRSLMQISDKHAGLAGAKILDERMRTSRKEYVAYRKKHVFRYEINERLDFLLKHSTSLKDFQEKARALDIEMDLSRKEVRYKLLVPLGGKYQERFARDRTLSKRGNYSLEGLEKKLSGNQVTLSVDEIKEAYQAHQAEKAEDFEIRLTVHEWQVLEETTKGLYIEVEYGLTNKGVVLIPARCVDKREDGSYDIFIQRNDWFYFTNPKDASQNKAIKGETLARQLSYDNGEQIIRKNPYISRMDQLVREFNFLSSHDVTDGRQFEALLDRFREQVSETQKELERLDDRLAELHKLQSVLLAMEEGSPEQREIAQTILNHLGLDSSASKSEIDKLIQEIQLERDALHQRFNSIVDEHEELTRIKQNVHTREQSRSRL
ncbi:helical hairpin domain-containing protein [Streptococcus cuniculi]|uniref:Relaxase n=1 Tax=Streptococcus cuniculi TaxID=1432788 RepID=A0A4Y9J831_9STRE|nr:relaxase/mobilization nuclease domain-containing protein [Streptococcus cuniculi]MBF0778909.1 relaxase/mobilization nuclease domain-containing protein [Streptococcus cuniculi]TFU97183.1 relaxase [Streptococcus cuniculi]